MTGIEFNAGEYIEFREPNAGGYGDPLERDPAMVREDVLDDFTTIELARDAYGVVFVDERRSRSTRRRRELRTKLRAQANGHSLNDLFSRDEGKLLTNRPPSTEAGNRALGLS